MSSKTGTWLVNRRKALRIITGGAAAGLSWPLQLGNSRAFAEPGSEKTTQGIVLAHRIFPIQWQSDEQFARLLKLLTTYHSAVDEVSLFDEMFPRPAGGSLVQLEQSAIVLKRRIDEFQAAGISRVGINISHTLGHGDHSSGLPLSLPAAVGHDGSASSSCVCPNSHEFRSYIKRRYALAARIHPDFIWVDDDVRMSHHGPRYPCFCPICLKKFGHGMERAGLIEALNAPNDGELRKDWSEFCATSLVSLCADIRQAVREVDPSIELGLMTIGYSHSTYADYPIRRMMEALGALRGRPGHGYYNDQVPTTLFNKTLDVGRQVRDYPAKVRTIQYELENYPYFILDKAARTLLNECTASLMIGCNGVAFNMFRQGKGTLEDYETVLHSVAEERPVWETLVTGVAGLPLVGLWPADHPSLMANREVDGTGWFWEQGVYDIQRPNILAGMGLPFTTDPLSANGILLAGRVAEAFTDDELRNFLGKGVLMDADALDVFWARGLGELTGVKPGQQGQFQVIERLTQHAMNGRYAGDERILGIGTSANVRSVIPLESSVGDLAHLVNHDGTDLGSCFSTYINPLGGRVAVSSCVPWYAVSYSAKRHQFLAVADWLTDRRMPIWIEQTVRVAPLVRMSSDGRRFGALLLNLALDPTGPLDLRMRAHPEQASWLSSDGNRSLVLRSDGNDTLIKIPSIPAWQTAFLLGS